MIKTAILTGISALAFAVAAPATAQSFYAGGSVQARIQQVQMEIQTGIQSGSISRQEAFPLREQLRRLNMLERMYSRDGLNGRERGDLMQRLNQLRQQVRIAERDGRYDRDGRADRYGSYDRNQRIDTNRDGWDDRDTDRDGRWDDNVRGGNGQWSERDSHYGRDDGRYDRDDDRFENEADGRVYLRVGQRVSTGLGALPYELRNQYRDGNGVYYRSDGRSVYQVDARTNLIVRIFGLNR